MTGNKEQDEKMREKVRFTCTDGLLASPGRGSPGGLTFAQETDQAPDEVAAAVAEGGFGQGDFPQAVTRRGALILGPESRGLRPPIQRRGGRCPAVCRVQLHRCAPACVCHVRRTQVLSAGYGEAYWEPGRLERSPPPGRRHPSNLLVIRSGPPHLLTN